MIIYAYYHSRALLASDESKATFSPKKDGGAVKRYASFCIEKRGKDVVLSRKKSRVHSCDKSRVHSPFFSLALGRKRAL